MKFKLRNSQEKNFKLKECISALHAMVFGSTTRNSGKSLCYRAFPFFVKYLVRWLWLMCYCRREKLTAMHPSMCSSKSWKLFENHSRWSIILKALLLKYFEKFKYIQYIVWRTFVEGCIRNNSWKLQENSGLKVCIIEINFRKSKNTWEYLKYFLQDCICF